MESAGLRGTYSTLPVHPSDLAGALRRLLAEGWTGLNVTSPHKTASAALCSSLDADASEAGAVNTLERSGESWAGRNTDVGGFARIISRYSLEDPLLVLGGGGAGRAAAAASRRAGAECVILARSPRGPGIRSLAELPGLLGSSRTGTLVNATTLGWRDDDGFPAEPAMLEGWTFVDLNYNSSWSFRSSLRGRARRIVPGEVLLVAQAALSFLVWTGFEPDETPALEALGITAEGAG